MTMALPLSSGSTVSIVLADDHAIFRDGLKLLLGLEPGFRVVGETGDLSQVKELVGSTGAQLLLIDYHMPGGDSAAVVAYLKQRYPALRVVALTGAHSGVILQQLLDVRADAVLLKDDSAQTLIAHLHAVMAGQRVIPPSVQALADQAQTPLTRRELQITRLLCSGTPSASIAHTLALSPKTVDKHRENIMRKLEVSSVPQLIHKVQAAGWFRTD